MKKTIYLINGFIPSDEDITICRIMKLQELGTKIKKYVWISIIDDGGIGTALDDYGEDNIEDALIQSTRFLDEMFKYIKTDDFNEVLDARVRMIEVLDTKRNNKNLKQ